MKSVALNKSSDEHLVFPFLKGLIISLIASFALVVLLAILIKWVPLVENYIYIGTLLIKVICSGLGAAIAIRGEARGLFKGILFGTLYIALATLVFSFLSDGFEFDLKTLLDLAVCAISSGIIGIIKVNR